MSERTTASDSRRETTPRTKPKRFPSRVFVLVRARVGADEAMTPVVCVRSRKNKNAITVSSTRRRRRPSLLPPPPPPLPPLIAAPRKCTFLPALRSETVFLESETPSPPVSTFRHLTIMRFLSTCRATLRQVIFPLALHSFSRDGDRSARRRAARPRGLGVSIPTPRASLLRSVRRGVQQ